MERTSIEPLHDNNRYEGFCVDLLEKVANIVGFNYTIQLVHDRAHGIQDNVTQKWNGMVGEIVEKVRDRVDDCRCIPVKLFSYSCFFFGFQRADLAIGDLSISVEREQVVEFSTPFMDLGIAILFRKAQPAPPSLLSFLSPFSKDVWFYMAITYVGVSIILFILAR